MHTCSVLPRPIQCATIDPLPLPFLICANDSNTEFHKNFTPST